MIDTMAPRKGKSRANKTDADWTSKVGNREAAARVIQTDGGKNRSNVGMVADWTTKSESREAAARFVETDGNTPFSIEVK